MAHDAQVIGIAGHLAELTAERIDIVLIAEAEYPTALGARLDFNSHAVDDGLPLIQDGNMIVMAAVISGIARREK